MAQNITLLGASYSDVPAVTLPKTGGGTARFDDCTVVTAEASDVRTGETFVASNGTVTSGSMPNGTATAPTTISGSQATLTTGTNTITLQKTLNVTPRITTAGYISAGTAGSALVSLNANVTTKAATTIYPSASDQSIASGTYTTGAQTIKGVTTSNLTADNIKQGVTVTVGDSDDADRILSVTGTYSGGGGGSNWTKLASQEYNVNTTSTSNTSVGNITLTLSDYNDPQTVLWIHIRDKAGLRNGYFYGSDAIFFHYQLASGNTNSLTVRPIIIYRGSSATAYSGAASAYGVYAYRLYYTSSNHYVQIYSRYNSSSTGTINGTYVCDVYKLTMPSGMTLFD